MLTELRVVGVISALLVGGFLVNKPPQEPALEVSQIPQEEVQELEPEVNIRDKDISILAVGDIMLGRYVETLMNVNGDDYPFANLEGFINDQYIVFANFEGPIVTSHVQTPDFTTSFDFHPRMAQVIADQGFNLVSLANNHTLDKGLENFEQTMVYLTEAGVNSIGHAREESLNYTYETEIEGQKFKFLAFNEAVNPIFSLENAISATNEAAKDEETFVAVSLHWGIEYQLLSAEFQQDIAHQLIDAGADLIIGHHPHVTQEVEVYQDKMIFYSLGNFIFDQYFSQDTQEGLAFEMTLTPQGDLNYELIPIKSKRSQPQVMNESETQDWLNSFAERASAPALQDSIRTGNIKLSWQ
jgi:poly-gamma-glutamate capsule biosynthesis protein CapA/YwtB (metallophosphatase superfamily)